VMCPKRSTPTVPRVEIRPTMQGSLSSHTWEGFIPGVEMLPERRVVEKLVLRSRKGTPALEE
jgi:hypothetical protein